MTAVSNSVHLRLSPAKHAEYSAQAAASGVGLTTYLKKRLEDGDDVARQLVDLRLSVAALRSGGEGISSPSLEGKIDKVIDLLQGGSQPNVPSMAAAIDPVMLLECLLMLRFSNQPEAFAKTRAELERHGLKHWTPPLPKDH